MHTPETHLPSRTYFKLPTLPHMETNRSAVGLTFVLVDLMSYAIKTRRPAFTS